MTVAAPKTSQIRQERKRNHDHTQNTRKDNYCIADPGHMFCLFHWKHRNKALVIPDRTVHSVLSYLFSVCCNSVTVAAVRAAHGNIRSGVSRFTLFITCCVSSRRRKGRNGEVHKLVSFHDSQDRSYMGGPNGRLHYVTAGLLLCSKDSVN